MTLLARTTVPLYTEAQAQRWLAWLARGMRRHGQTIFQIEGLQPSWLSPDKELEAFILSTRLAWGLYVGLIFGLISGLTEGIETRGFIGTAWLSLSAGTVGLSAGQLTGLLKDFFATWADNLRSGPLIGAILGLLLGLGLGLAFGLADSSSSRRHGYTGAGSDESRTRALIRGIGVAVLVAAAISVPIGWLFDKMIYGLELVPVDRQVEGAVKGVVFAAVSGLAFGVIRTNRSVLRKLTDAIRPAETLRWSWRSSLSVGSRGARIGLVTGLILGVFFGLIRGLGIVPIAGLLLSALVYGLVDGLLGGLLGGLIAGFFGGFQPSVREMKTVPNQGIHLSIESAIRIGSPAGLLMGLIVGLIAGSPLIGLTYFILTALVIGVWFGGLEVIEHGILRVIVAVRDHAALNYARFLDYAAEELKFLQKVGGGYSFIHRYLLEYFAELEAAEPSISAGLSSGAVHDEDPMRQSPPVELASY